MLRHIDAAHAGDPLELVGHVWPLEPDGYRWATTNPHALGDATSWPDAVAALLEASGIPAVARCRIDRTTTPTPERNPQ